MVYHYLKPSLLGRNHQKEGLSWVPTHALLTFQYSKSYACHGEIISRKNTLTKRHTAPVRTRSPRGIWRRGHSPQIGVTQRAEYYQRSPCRPLYILILSETMETYHTTSHAVRDRHVIYLPFYRAAPILARRYCWAYTHPNSLEISNSCRQLDRMNVWKADIFVLYCCSPLTASLLAIQPWTF